MKILAVIGKIIGVLLLLTILGAVGIRVFAPKTEFEYYQESEKFLQANEKQAAEKVLKEGILKYPTSGLLKSELFKFYMGTNQWDVAEDYYRIAGAGFDGGERIVASFATHFFEARDWSKAYTYYIASGLNYEYLESEKSRCSFAGLEEYRNAAAAALNMNDSAKILEAYQKMEVIAASAKCTSAEPRQRFNYLNEVKGWLHRK